MFKVPRGSLILKPVWQKVKSAYGFCDFGDGPQVPGLAVNKHLGTAETWKERSKRVWRKLTDRRVVRTPVPKTHSEVSTPCEPPYWSISRALLV